MCTSIHKNKYIFTLEYDNDTGNDSKTNDMLL